MENSLDLRKGDRISIRVDASWQLATIVGVLLYHALVQVDGDGDEDDTLVAWMDVRPPF